MSRKGYKRADILGQEIADKMSRVTSLYNKSRLLSQDTRLKMSVAKKGALNFNWKGGLKRINEIIRNGLEIKAWRRTVLKRDGYTCQSCGATGVYLQTHHIKKFSDYPELRLDVNNGQTLCLSCHKQTKGYGGKWQRAGMVR